MIKISSPEVQLRQNRNLLLLVGGCSTIAGLFLWSAMPFVFNNPKDRINICFRYLALLGSLSCGIAAVASGSQLQRIAPLLKAIETAERNDFIDELASSQYVQQQRYQQEAIAALQAPLQNPIAQQNEFSYNDRNDGIARDTEMVESDNSLPEQTSVSSPLMAQSELLTANTPPEVKPDVTPPVVQSEPISESAPPEPRSASDTPATKRKSKPRSQSISEPLTQAALAKRLGVDRSRVSRVQSQSNFATWSKERDPDGIAWKFNSKTKRFYPLS